MNGFSFVAHSQYDFFVALFISIDLSKLSASLKCNEDYLGMGFSDSQQGASSPFGTAVALFPILKGAWADAYE